MNKYGPWALIAGASEGIGAAFARALAKDGINVVLVARRAEPLELLAASLPVETQTVADLSTRDGLEPVFLATKGLEVGLVVVNAALSPNGPFHEADPEELERALDLNCRAPMLLAHHFLPAMISRRRGGLVIMSSLAGQQGSPGLSLYAGTKAFGAILAEGLWAEAREHGVDVVTCVAGAVSTPGLTAGARLRLRALYRPKSLPQQHFWHLAGAARCTRYPHEGLVALHDAPDASPFGDHPDRQGVAKDSRWRGSRQLVHAADASRAPRHGEHRPLGPHLSPQSRARRWTSRGQ